jgi:hypothetical protein
MPQGTPSVLGGMAPVSDGEAKRLRIGEPTRSQDAIGVPSTGLSLGGMLASRARLRFARPEVDTARELAQQDQPSVAGREAGESVAKEGPISVQRMGSTSLR